MCSLNVLGCVNGLNMWVVGSANFTTRKGIFTLFQCYKSHAARVHIPSAHRKQCTNTVELCAGNFSLAPRRAGFLCIDCQLFQAFEHTSKEFTCNINWQLWLF